MSASRRRWAWIASAVAAFAAAACTAYLSSTCVLFESGCHLGDDRACVLLARTLIWVKLAIGITLALVVLSIALARRAVRAPLTAL